MTRLLLPIEYNQIRRRIALANTTSSFRSCASEKMLAEDPHMSRSPRIHFVGNRVFARYTHRRYKYVDGKHQRSVNQTRRRSIPSYWFYEHEEEIEWHE